MLQMSGLNPNNSLACSCCFGLLNFGRPHVISFKPTIHTIKWVLLKCHCMLQSNDSFRSQVLCDIVKFSPEVVFVESTLVMILPLWIPIFNSNLLCSWFTWTGRLASCLCLIGSVFFHLVSMLWGQNALSPGNLKQKLSSLCWRQLVYHSSSVSSDSSMEWLHASKCGKN